MSQKMSRFFASYFKLSRFSEIIWLVFIQGTYKRFQIADSKNILDRTKTPIRDVTLYSQERMRTEKVTENFKGCSQKILGSEGCCETEKVGKHHLISTISHI